MNLKLLQTFKLKIVLQGLNCESDKRLLYIRNYPNKEVEVMKDIETILIGKVNFGFYSTNSFV